MTIQRSQSWRNDSRGRRAISALPSSLWPLFAFGFQLGCYSDTKAVEDEVNEESVEQKGDEDPEFPPDPGPAIKDACSVGDCLRIEPGTELCQGFRKLKPDFGAALKKKARIRINAGEFPLDNLKFNGEIELGSERLSFSAKRTKSEIEHFRQGSLLTATVQAEASTGDLFTLRLLMTAKKTSSNLAFTLDSLQTLGDSYKQLSLQFKHPLAIFGDAKGAAFDACTLSDSAAESLEFDLANGDSVVLDIKTRFSQQYKSSQYGLVKSAKGRISGFSFDVNRWSELHYGTFRFTDSIQAPTLGVRFPPGSPIRGIGLVPTTDDNKPYRAFILESDLRIARELEILSAKIPSEYGLNFNVDIEV